MNIADHVSRVARAHPQHAAIRFEGRTLTYGVLDACADALAGALKKNGIERGDRVALYLPNIPAFALAYLATLRAGAIAVSVNAVFKAEEVKYIVNDSGAKLVFTTAELLPNLPRRDCLGVRAGAGPFESAIRAKDSVNNIAFMTCVLDEMYPEGKQ